MDQLFLELIGKPTLNPPKIITIVAENFSLLEDQARFLKATLAIPTVKQLPLDNISKRLIQIGPLQGEIGDQIRKARWALNQYEDFSESICDRMSDDLMELRNRSAMFLNDVSRLELSSNKSSDESKKLIKLVDKLKRLRGHFMILLYQNSVPKSSSKLLRDLEYISDAVVRVHSCKAGYFKSIWWQTIPSTKTLIQAKVETGYYTSKVGKFYWSPDLLCFYEKKKVSKQYDMETDTCPNSADDQEGDKKSSDNEEEEIVEKLNDTRFDSSRRSREDERDSTLPYTQAQNPEQSRIFYYPDKEDDIDEDDPDNDLGI